MTTRGFLLCYAGSVILVAAIGGSTYQALRHQRAETHATPTSIAVAEAEPPLAAPTLSVEKTEAAPAAKPRPGIAKAPKRNPPDHRRVMIAHAPARRPPATIASARPLALTDRPWPYAAPLPPLPYSGSYAYPVQYPDYYPYYPRYRYYRSF